MNIAAMMRRSGGGFANVIDLIAVSSPWTVPAGVTQITLTGQMRGGLAGPNTIGSTGGGGAGAGAAMIAVPFATTPGTTIHRVQTNGGNTGDVRTFTFRLNSPTGTFLFLISEGDSAGVSDGRGGEGGRVDFGAGGFTTGGIAGAPSPPGQNGGDGEVLAVSSGYIVSGGGGGSGALVSPPGLGGNGGRVAGLPMQLSSGIWGQGGGGIYQNAQTRTGASTVTDRGTSYLYAMW